MSKLTPSQIKYRKEKARVGVKEMRRGWLERQNRFLGKPSALGKRDAAKLALAQKLLAEIRANVETVAAIDGRQKQ